jgi:nitroreductase
MKTISFSASRLLLAVLLVWPAQIWAADANSTAAKDVNSAGAVELKPIQLPKPQTDGGKPLMQALKDRKSSREYSAEKLPPQVLSNMLWAACGINRPDGKRTAPTAVNWQEIDVYVATAEGLYLYDAKENSLKPILAGDIRAATGPQPFVKDAPVNLVFVADYSKMGNAPASQKDFYAATDTGFISQNVYLYCASEGMATVVRGYVDKPTLAGVMKLRPDQKVILAQSVGYPKK